jgi:hypothetical protein
VVSEAGIEQVVWVDNTGLIFPMVAALSLASAMTALFIRR